MSRVRGKVWQMLLTESAGGDFCMRSAGSDLAVGAENAERQSQHPLL